MKTLLSRWLMLLVLLSGAAQAQVVSVFTSATVAPLVLGDGRGVYPDLVAYLNQRRPGGLSFKLRYVPRKRLQVLLEAGKVDGLVIGMMPEWFGDARQKKYLWSAPFSSDGHVLVSRTSRPLGPEAPAALVGTSVGVTSGYVYPELDSWLRKSRLLRVEGISDEKNLDKLLLGEIDCVIVAESVARYFIRVQQIAARLHVVRLPGAATQRRVLAPHSQRAVFEQVAPVLNKLRDDPAWRASAARYE